MEASPLQDTSWDPGQSLDVALPGVAAVNAHFACPRARLRALPTCVSLLGTWWAVDTVPAAVLCQFWRGWGCLGLSGTHGLELESRRSCEVAAAAGTSGCTLEHVHGPHPRVHHGPGCHAALQCAAVCHTDSSDQKNDLEQQQLLIPVARPRIQDLAHTRDSRRECGNTALSYY